VQIRTFIWDIYFDLLSYLLNYYLPFVFCTLTAEFFDPDSHSHIPLVIAPSIFHL